MSLWACKGCGEILHSSQVLQCCGELEFFQGFKPIQAEFKCQECNNNFAQNLFLKGLFVDKCLYCLSICMDCLNLEECVEICRRLDNKQQ